ncbi:MAG TPA: hypothetical protein VK364_10805 [Hymenobacter sp.]|nr:hypothetical protein [Hymenobacter sp.]
MSSNLDYLNPDLQPLEDKINTYLAVEKDLRKAEQDSIGLSLEQAQVEAASAFDQRPATGSFPQHSDEVQQEIQNLRDDLTRLRHDIIALLPVRNEWVKVNLGYGPSRVGAFSAPGATPDIYELRIIH